MRNIDWPLAILLAVMFVVMSVLRWRYFMRRAQRRERAVSPPPPAHEPHDRRDDQERNSTRPAS